MIAWEKLPKEILNNVFQMLSKKDNQQCSLTCKQWKSVAETILFKNIPRLNDENIADLANTLTLSRRSPFDSYNKSPGEFVKTIDCSGLSREFDVELLGTVFPNLKVITIEKREQQALCDNLYQLMMKGMFSKLMKIPFNNWNTAYYEVVMARKDSIKELELWDVPTINNTAAHEMMQKLHLFIKLNVIELYSFDEDTNVNLGALLSTNFPVLNELIYKAAHPHMITVDGSFFDTCDDQPLKSVKGVYIDNIFQALSTGDKPYYYIMKRFPKADKLSIFCKPSVTLINNYTAPTRACLTQFLEYLFNMKQSTVGPFTTDDGANEMIESFLNYYALQQKSPYFKNVRIQLKIDYYPLHPEERIHINDNTTFITAHHRYQNDFKICCIKVTYKTELTSTLQKHQSLLETIKDINIDRFDFWDRRLALHFRPNSPIKFSTLFDYFRNLKNVYLSNLFGILEEEDLHLEDETSTSILESLQFSNCILSKEIYHKVSKMFPNLKSLAIFVCQHIERHVHFGSSFSKIVSITMPFTHLDKLHFKFYLKGDYTYPISRILIRLKSAEKKPIHFDFSLLGILPSKIDPLETDFTNDDYQLCVEDPRCVIYDVYCNLIQSFIVETVVDVEGKRLAIM